MAKPDIATVKIGVEFSLQEPDSIMRKATKSAVAAAKERTVYLAELNGLSVGRLISISESNGGGDPYLTARLTAVYELVPSRRKL